jgi:hypothetical protein
MLIFLIILNLGIWYILYGLECYLNGGSIGRNQFLMVFQCFYEDLLWVLPGGISRKIKYCNEAFGNLDMVDKLPGIPHFIFMHICIPFFMPVIYLILK